MGDSGRRREKSREGACGDEKKRRKWGTVRGGGIERSRRVKEENEKEN